MTARLLTRRAVTVAPPEGKTIYEAPDMFTDTITVTWTGSLWQVTQSDMGAIAVDDTFSTLEELYGNVSVAGGDVTIILPGNITIDEAVTLDGASVGWEGQVDVNGDPTTVFGVSAARKFHCLSQEPDPIFMWKNIRIGRTAAQWAIDFTVSTGEGVRMTYACEMIFNNVIWCGCREENIYVSASTDEQNIRERGKVLVYFSEQFGFGGVSSDHGNYIHSVHTLRFVNTFNYAPQVISHSLKGDNDRTQLIRSVFARNMGIGPTPSADNTPVNLTHACDILVHESIIQQEGGTKNLLELIARTNAGGGMTLKYPGPFDRAHFGGSWRDGPAWVDGGTNCTHWGGVVLSAGYAMGATSVTVAEMGPVGQQGSGTWIDFDIGTSYTVRLVLNDNTVQEVTGTPTDVPSTGRATFTIPGGLNAAMDGADNPVLMKVASAAWDRFKGAADYYGANNWFDRNVNGGKANTDNWDPATSEVHTTQVFESMFIADGNTVREAIEFPFNNATTYLGRSAGKSLVSFPHPPMDDDLDRWADVAGAANNTDPLGTEIASAVLGDEPTSGDAWFYPHATLVKDVGFVSVNAGGFTQQFDMSWAQNTLRHRAVDNDVSWVSGGSLTAVTSGNKSPHPTPTATTTLDGAHSQGATTLTLVSNTGVSANQAIQVVMDLNRREGFQPMYTTTVVSVDGGGKDIVVTDGLPSPYTATNKLAMSGSDNLSGLVVSFTAAGASPSAIPDISLYPV